jgi:hypothetical protein
MSKITSIQPPSPSPASTAAADSTHLGTWRDAFPIVKQRPFVQARIVGYVYEFDNGFIWQPEDAGPQAFRWDQVATVNWFASRHYVNGGYTGTMFWLTLATTDGRNQKFSGNCKDPAAKGARNADPRAADYLLYQFLSRARDTISAAQLPGAAEALNRGEQLTFGDLQLSTVGIQAQKGFVPWSSIKAVTIDQGRVSVRQEGKFFSLSSQGAEKIPNCPLFLTLAQVLTHQAATT